MTSEGQTLAAVLDRVVESVARSDKSLGHAWILDRDVDPNTTLSLEASGPTTGHVIADVCRQAELHVIPWERTLILGRSDWLAGVMNALCELRVATNPSDLLTRSIPIHWADGTTPRVILADLVDGSNADRVESFDPLERLSWLPHDHWQAKAFQANRLHVVSLVLAQFGWRLKSRSDLLRLRQLTEDNSSDLPDFVVDLDPDSKIAYRYPEGEWLGDWKRSHALQAKSLRIRSVASHRVILAEPRTHLLMMLAAVGTTPPAAHQVAGANPNAVYDLELLNKPAVNVLTTLAQAGQRKLIVDPDADLRTRTLVSLSAKKATLRELIQRVCDEAGLAVQVDESTVRVGLSTPDTGDASVE
ncbi:MAG: hypothetical protein AAGD07_02485 [Planctomycetota bacterium]